MICLDRSLAQAVQGCLRHLVEFGEDPFALCVTKTRSQASQLIVWSSRQIDHVPVQCGHENVDHFRSQTAHPWSCDEFATSFPDSQC